MTLDEIVYEVQQRLSYFRSMCGGFCAQVEAYGAKLETLTREARKRPKDGTVRGGINA
jgi:hypothetical protein